MSAITSPHRPDAMNLCFTNPLIVQKILDYHSPDPLEQVKFRLLNKRCNFEILRQIRKTHKEIEIKYAIGRNGMLDVIKPVFWFFVNKHLTSCLTVTAFFRFLTQVAGVRIEEFRCATDFCSFARIEDQKILHDLLIPLLMPHKLKVFTGFADFCANGCMDCEVHAVRCEEADLQFDVLRIGFADRKKHFKKLIVTDLLLQRIAAYCYSQDLAENETLSILESLVTSNISCDHLQFVLSHYLIQHNRSIDSAIPLKVLTRILDVWKPKSIGLEFQRNDAHKNWCGHYKISTFRFDTGLKLFNQHAFSAVGDWKQVEVDLKDCWDSDKENRERYSSFEKFVDNVKTLFRTEHLILPSWKWQEESAPRQIFNQEEFWKLLRIVMKHEPFRITVKIPINPCIRPMRFEIPESFYYENIKFHCSVSVVPNPKSSSESLGHNRIVKVFCITDREGKFKLDLEFSVCKPELATAVKKNKWRMKKGFLKHFL